MRSLPYCVAILVFLGGCMSPDIAVIGVDRGDIQSPLFSGTRQVIVGVDRKTRSFKTLVRDGDNFVIRTFSSSCRMLGESRLPLSLMSYAGTSKCAVSPDGGKLVYQRDNSRNIYLYDIQQGRETVLWEEVGPRQLQIHGLAWLSDSKIVIYTQEVEGDAFEKATYQIVEVDIDSGHRRSIFRPVYPAQFSYTISPDASFLAFSDGKEPLDIDGYIKIVNFESGAVLKTLGSGENLIGHACWSPDGSEIAYVEGGELIVYSMASSQTRILHTFSKEILCYYVIFGEKMVGYIAGRSGALLSALVLLDSQTGRELRSVGATFNGGIFLLDNGHTFVAETGI